MSTRTVRFLKFASAHIVLAALAFAALVEFATHTHSSGSAVGSALGIAGFIFFMGPFVVIFAGYLAWMVTRLSSTCPQSGFQWRLPVYSMLAAIFLVAFASVTGGLAAIPFQLTLFVPAAMAFIGAQAAAMSSFGNRFAKQ